MKTDATQDIFTPEEREKYCLKPGQRRPTEAEYAAMFQGAADHLDAQLARLRAKRGETK